MDTKTAHILNTINQEFYRNNAATFSATRAQAWQGWERVISLCPPFTSVLDVACGNQRFRAFLDEVHPDKVIEYYGIDACDELAACDGGSRYQKLDLVDAVLKGDDLAALVKAPPCDLVVSFGFMHHVPGMQARLRIMEMLGAQTKPGGMACVSFWRFMEEEKLAAKARAVTERALGMFDITLDEGDYFLDWQSEEASLRYCHSFIDAEVDTIIHTLSASFELVERFESDGRNSALNTYVVLRKLD